MSSLRNVILLTVLLLPALPTITNAEQFSTGYGEIATIRSYSQDAWTEKPTLIQIEGQSVRSSCANQDFGKGLLNYWAVMPEDTQLISIVLMAYASGQSIRITSNDDEASKLGNVCKVVYVDVMKQ